MQPLTPPRRLSGSTSVRMQLCVLTVLLVNVFNNFVSSLYFNIGQYEKKCFVKEIPDDTVLIGNFQTRLVGHHRYEDLSANQNAEILVEAKDPDKKVVLSQWDGSEGTFKFTSQKPGRYQICLSSRSWPGPLPAVHLDIRTYQRAKDNVTELQRRVQELAEQVQHIQRELNYQRFREKYFHDINLNTNMWIFWWPLVRSLYVVAFIMWNTNTW